MVLLRRNALYKNLRKTLAINEVECTEQNQYGQKKKMNEATGNNVSKVNMKELEQFNLMKKHDSQTDLMLSLVTLERFRLYQSNLHNVTKLFPNYVLEIKYDLKHFYFKPAYQ